MRLNIAQKELPFFPICGGFMNKHDTCAKFQMKVIKMYCFIFYSVFVLTFYSCLWL